MANKRKYVLWFAHEHIEFRMEEISSLTSLLKLSFVYLKKPVATDPYWLIESDSEEEVRRLARRSVTLRSCIELWGAGSTISELHANVRNYPSQLMEQYLSPERSFKIEVDTFGKKISCQEKCAKLDAFDYIPFTGPVRMKDPEVVMQYLEFYGSDHNSPPPPEPTEVFFGRWVVDGVRQLIKQISLKTRKFIGNTSMDPQLSLLMANQAQVKDNDIILDPFVGSGSLLVAAASFGGFVVGADIDFMMLHARTRPSRISQKTRDKDESVRANMRQYNLEHRYIDVLVNDFSTNFWRHCVKFNAIITDPPYGIREGITKIGTRKESFDVNIDDYAEHYPEKIDYSLSEVYHDLLRFAAHHLELSGRLVCWFPIFRPDYNEDRLPQHACLILIANSEQILSNHTSRRLLTYEKVKEPTLGSTQNPEEIQDFRVKFYGTREETRSERRINKAKLREHGRLEHERRKLANINVDDD